MRRSKKSLIIAAAICVCLSSLAGCGDSQPQTEPQPYMETRSVMPSIDDIIASESEAATAPSSATEPEEKEEEGYDRAIGNMYDFEKAGAPEINGHISQVGGGSSYYRTFVMTDDHKVYIKDEDSSDDKFVYFCTVDADTEEMLTILPYEDNTGSLYNFDDDDAVDHNQLAVRKKDGTYVYYNDGVDKPIAFSAEGLAYVDHDFNGLKVFTVEGGTLYVTEYNDDGSVKAEKLPISVKQDKEYVHIDNVTAVIDSYTDGMMVLTNDGQLFDLFEDRMVYDVEAPDAVYVKGRDITEMPENMDKIIPFINDGAKLVYSVPGEDNKIYVRNINREKLTDDEAVTEIALPEGCMVNDIEKLRYASYDTYYLTMADKKVYIGSHMDSEPAEQTWKLNKALTELYTQGKIVELGCLRRYALCDDGNLYDMSYRVFDED